jgi:hypothetical protein
MTQPSRVQFEAANQIAETVLNKLNSNGKIHYQTVISACASLAGTFYFRSFNLINLKAEPGDHVLSEEANSSFPVLAQYLSAALEMLNVKLDGSKLNSGIDEQHNPTWRKRPLVRMEAKDLKNAHIQAGG